MDRHAVLPPTILLDPLLGDWLREDIGRGDRATQGLFAGKMPTSSGEWVAKQAGVVAGLPIAARAFRLLDETTEFVPLVAEGEPCRAGQTIARFEGKADALLMGERVALNLAMRLSGIATLTRRYVEAIADLPAQLADTRKTTPGLRLLEKYATQVGGAVNHRMGLDDMAMIKDNHIQAAGGIGQAISRVRQAIPYPMAIEVETTTLAEVEEALRHGADIIMLDNMTTDRMKEAVRRIREKGDRVKIEASGNVTLETIRIVAETGVDYISTSAPITRSPWLDLSMRFK